MSATASIEIEGTSYGTMQLPDEFRRSELVPATGCVYVCTRCARAWAKITVEGRPHHIWGVSCERCGNAHGLELGGTIWQLWDSDFNKALPLAVLKREAELCVKGMK